MKNSLAALVSERQRKKRSDLSGTADRRKCGKRQASEDPETEGEEGWERDGERRGVKAAAVEGLDKENEYLAILDLGETGSCRAVSMNRWVMDDLMLALTD